MKSCWPRKWPSLIYTNTVIINRIIMHHYILHLWHWDKHKVLAAPKVHDVMFWLLGGGGHEAEKQRTLSPSPSLGKIQVPWCPNNRPRYPRLRHQTHRCSHGVHAMDWWPKQGWTCGLCTPETQKSKCIISHCAPAMMDVIQQDQGCAPGWVDGWRALVTEWKTVLSLCLHSHRILLSPT